MAAAALVMATADGTPASATVVDVYDHPVQIERDTLYYTNFPLNDPSDAYDHWFDGPLVAGDYVPLSYNATNGCATCSINKTFTVSDIDSGTAHIEVEVWVFVRMMTIAIRLDQWHNGRFNCDIYRQCSE